MNLSYEEYLDKCGFTRHVGKKLDRASNKSIKEINGMLTLEELKKDRDLIDEVNWEMTPEEAVRLYLEWGNN